MCQKVRAIRFLCSLFELYLVNFEKENEDDLFNQENNQNRRKFDAETILGPGGLKNLSEIIDVKIIKHQKNRSVQDGTRQIKKQKKQSHV